MNIREQLSVLVARGVEFVVVGGQAGVLRQAIEFSHDLDILIRSTTENAERLRVAIQEITGAQPELALLLGRDFQQYIDEATGTELDVHLKLIAIPDYDSAIRSSSAVDFLGISVPALELPALYAAKRTDRPRDAVHRQAIEHRLRRLVLDDLIEPDEVVLAVCLDDEVSRMPEVADALPRIARSTAQALLQARLMVLGRFEKELVRNAALASTTRSLIALDEPSRTKLFGNPARVSALLSRIPLVLPSEGHRVKMRHGMPAITGRRRKHGEP